MKEDDIRPKDILDRYLELAQRDARGLLAEGARFVPVRCPACDSARQAPGLEKLGFRYVTCEDCRSLYASPRPDPDQLAEFYRSGESVRYWSSDFYKRTSHARREAMFRPRARLVAELLDRHQPAARGLFADIGPGYGLFLEEVRILDLFQKLVGIEPGPDLAAVCREKGFSVIEKRVEAVAAEECQADFVSAFEVLEHVFSPIEFLRGARRVLRPGGIILLTTLSSSGFDIQVLWERARSVLPPHHLNLLSVAGMELLVARAGLKALDISTPGLLDVDIVSNAAKSDPTLVLPRFAASLLQSGEAARQDFQGFLSRHRLSSHIRVVAQA